MKKLDVYIAEGQYVGTIYVEDDASDFDIQGEALEAAHEWVENSIYWEPEEEDWEPEEEEEEDCEF